MKDRQPYILTLDRFVSCRPPGFAVMQLEKYLAGGLQSGHTVNFSGVQYILTSDEICPVKLTVMSQAPFARESGYNEERHSWQVLVIVSINSGGL